MKNLEIAWRTLFAPASFQIAVAVLANILVTVNGLPALGVIGAALLLLVSTSILNWIFKTAWNERINPDSPEN